jgi:exopolysaccharide production protein ExoZ
MTESPSGWNDMRIGWPASLAAQNKEVVGIQAVRFAAASAVVVDHLIQHLCGLGRLPAAWLPVAERFGLVGVFLFFVISGYVMVLTNYGKFGVAGSTRDFLARRVVRIWPMYALATLAVFASRHGGNPYMTGGNLARSLLFIPYAGEGGLGWPVLGKGWTLNYEMFFYLVFAGCLLFRRPVGIALAAAILLLLGLDSGAVTNGVTAFYWNDILLYFVAGMLLATLLQNRRVRWPRPRQASTAIALACALFVITLTLQWTPLLSSVETAISIVLLTVALYLVSDAATRFADARAQGVALVCGDASYVLYLFHGFVLVALTPLLLRPAGVPLWLAMPIVGVLAVIACVAMHLYVEKPLQRRLMGYYRSLVTARRGATPPPADSEPVAPVAAALPESTAP